MSDGNFRPLIVPVFIPYHGCPHRCIFCEQEKITSQRGQYVDKEHIEQILNTAIHSKAFDPQRKPEIAFYGGTFTGLPFARIMDLLETAKSFIGQGRFCSIRVSTRPDTLDEKCLKAMKDNGVSTVELGVQSMDDHVLTNSKRGHTAEDSVTAVQLLKKYGFNVGIQLMPGLPGDSRDTFYSTVSKVIDMHPDMVRLYPALVIRGTELESLYNEGFYQPLELDGAVEICMESCIRLEENSIPVIRIGLMSSPSLLEDGQIIAGPWHTAFGFLVRSGIYRKNIGPELPGPGEFDYIKLTVSTREIPLIRGYRNQGIKEIEIRTGAKIVKVEGDDSISDGRIKITGQVHG